MRKTTATALGALLVLAAAAPLRAQDNGSRFGIGFQSAFPAYGISGLYDVSDRITAQAILGAFGTLTTVSGRVMYNFQKEEKHALYGFGTTGLWRHSYRSVLGNSDTESVLGVGGGAGVELNWRTILDGDNPDSTFPRLFSSFDIGFVAASFDFYDFSGLVIGAGFHYRF